MVTERFADARQKHAIGQAVLHLDIALQKGVQVGERGATAMLPDLAPNARCYCTGRGLDPARQTSFQTIAH